MADERCPLLELREGLEIPELCREQCGHLWDEAVVTQVPIRDDYEDYHDGEDETCAHMDAEYSHDDLQVNQRNPSQRIYSIVDMCINCGTELGESIYTFICHNN